MFEGFELVESEDGYAVHVYSVESGNHLLTLTHELVSDNEALEKACLLASFREAMRREGRWKEEAPKHG